MIPSRTLPAVVGLLVVLAGCDANRGGHPALGRALEPLPVVSLADPPATPSEFEGKVTLLNLWGTWCPPCRRELPALARLAARLTGEARFQLVAISCGSTGDEPAEALAAETRGFLAGQRLAIDAWVFADPLAFSVFASQVNLEAFPTTFLVGPDARVRAVWVGYRPGDEAAMAAAVLALLKEQMPSADPDS
jgi:thiol-disulfide isomerase/thioredoxin